MAVILLNISCEKTNSSEVNQTTNSRIINENLKQELSSLIQLYDKTFSEYDRNGLFHFNFWMSENYLYLHLTKMDCSNRYLEHYTFVEEIDKVNYRIDLLEPFQKPERAFDLSNLEINPKNFEPVICDDFSYLLVRFKLNQDKITRDKIITSLEGLEWEGILAEEDLDFCDGNLIEEPETSQEEKSK